MSALGYLFALLSAVMNGSFVAFAKIGSVASCDLHPILFNFYVSLGVFLSCWLALPFLPLVGEPVEIAFTGFGVLAGSLFVGAAACLLLRHRRWASPRARRPGAESQS